MNSAPTIPDRFLRHEVHYRTLAAAGVRGAGFMLKPTSAGGYRERVSRDYIAVYVLRGSGTFVDWNDVVHQVHAGCLVQMPAGKRHTVEQTGDGRWAECYMQVDGAFAEHLARLGTIDESRPLLRPGIDLDLVERFDRILHDLRDAPDNAMPLTLARAHETLVVAHALDRRRRNPDPTASLVESACVVLSARPEHRIDLDGVARQFGLSYERFRKVFRERIGLAPGEYRIRRRIDRARALIAQQRLSNKEVAYALGYPDPFTFSKQFKQIVGLSPDAFRRTV